MTIWSYGNDQMKSERVYGHFFIWAWATAHVRLAFSHLPNTLMRNHDK